jgi:hypothetical protein
LKRNIVLKISPPPSLPKRGNSSLLQREGRRDLVFDVYTIMDSLVIIKEECVRLDCLPEGGPEDGFMAFIFRPKNCRETSTKSESPSLHSLA